MNNIFSLKNSVIISLDETVNNEVALMCSKLTLPQFQYLFDLSSTKRHDDYSSMTEYTKIINYCNAIISSDNKHNVPYGYAIGSDIGRLQSKKPSIQRLYNGFRGILCDKKMIDYDMCNMHPQILLNLCIQHSIGCSKLLHYSQNRDECLASLINSYGINRTDAKALFLKCINKIDLTDKINKKKVKEKSFFYEFDYELTNIIKSLYKIYKKDPLFKKYKVQEWNKEGKLINKVLCHKENAYLNEALNDLINNNLLEKKDISVLMFDGFMAYYHSDLKRDAIISFLNKKFKKRNIKWTYKEHNTELLEPLQELQSKGELLNNDKFNGANIIEIIDHILKSKDGILKDKLYKDDNNFYYITHDKILMNEKMIKSDLFDIISKQSYTVFDEYKGNAGAVVHASKIPKHIDSIVKGLLDKCPKNPTFIDDIWNWTQYKLFFLNGYYDFKKNSFIKNSECNRSNYTFVKINKKYTYTNNKKIRDEINKRIFNPIFTVDGKDQERSQLLDYFKYTVAHYMAGNITLKKWSLFQGLRNSGKGIIGDLLKNCFEKYVMTTNSGNFNFKKNVTDSQKALSWLVDYQFVRIALTSEISVYDDQKLDGNMIKKFTSGGDYLSARKNFQDETEFRIQAGLIVCCNDCPPIQPSDALEFCDEYNMKSKFVDKDFDHENDEIKGFTYYSKDDSLKSDFLKKEEVINELITMIIESYYKEVKFPEKLSKENKVDNMDENDYKRIEELFTITNDIKDTITNDKLRYICKEYKLTFTLKKVKQLLKGMGAKEFRSQKQRGMQYIKMNIDQESDDEEANPLDM